MVMAAEAVAVAAGVDAEAVDAVATVAVDATGATAIEIVKFKQICQKLSGPKAVRFGARFFVLAISIGCAALCAEGQPRQTDVWSHQMADVIARAKGTSKTIAVFDFAENPSGQVNELGRDLATRLADALEADQRLTVIDRMRIFQRLDDDNLEPTAMSDLDSAITLGEELDSTYIVVGDYSLSDGQVLLGVRCYLTSKKGKQICKFHDSFALTPALTDESKKSIEPGALRGLPRGGQQGYSVPACISCPAVTPTDEAAKHRLHAEVLAAVIVGKDGRIQNAWLYKKLPYGMTEQSIRILKTWQLQPVLAPDGTSIVAK